MPELEAADNPIEEVFAYTARRAHPEMSALCTPPCTTPHCTAPLRTALYRPAARG
eukprot:SAG11_NODE_21885_length_416_cov_1.895899_1_plen_54_part_10